MFSYSIVVFSWKRGFYSLIFPLVIYFCYRVLRNLHKHVFCSFMLLGCCKNVNWVSTAVQFPYFTYINWQTVSQLSHYKEKRCTVQCYTLSHPCLLTDKMQSQIKHIAKSQWEQNQHLKSLQYLWSWVPKNFLMIALLCLSASALCAGSNTSQSITSIFSRSACKNQCIY